MKFDIKNNVLDILLAEDDADDRFFFEKALNELAIATKLTMFNDGEQLMHHLNGLAGEYPDIIFLDINMPRKSGYECMREIKESAVLSGIFVVMFSTFYSRHINFEQEMLIKLHNIGMEDFIQKPRNFEQLKMVIEKALRRVQEKKIQSKDAKNLRPPE
jgi:CheY-like chemotaxis protein